jgi:hypothetical protein
MAWSIVALLGACVAIVPLSVGPLRWPSVPMIDWMRAAESGPRGFVAALPGLAVHIVAWSALVGGGYVAVRRRRACP